jgi:nitroreductase
LARVFEAARWAASSSNAQPWRFLLTRAGEASFQKLHACLSRGNQPWTERVPVLLLSVTDTVFAAKGDKPARDNPTAKHDLGLAAANLALQATALELYVHPMAGLTGTEYARSLRSPRPMNPSPSPPSATSPTWTLSRRRSVNANGRRAAANRSEISCLKAIGGNPAAFD